MVIQMVWSKLFYYLKRREFHNYRYLLNAQVPQYFRGLDLEPLDGLVPGFHTETDPSVDCKGFMLERFLHQNGFRSLETRTCHPAPRFAKVTTLYLSSILCSSCQEHLRAGRCRVAANLLCSDEQQPRGPARAS